MATQLLEREVLRDFDESIAGFQRTMEEAANSGALDQESLDRFVATARELAARVNSGLAPEIDDHAANLINRRLIAVLTLNLDDVATLDAADRYLVAFEGVRHVIRDLLDEQQPEALRRQAQEIIALLEQWLPSVAVGELAALLGHSVRQLQRRRHEQGPASSREQLVARLVAILRHAWTDAGVIAWFDRPRGDLGGRRPIDLLDEADQERALLVAARSGRVQGGV